MFAIIVLFNLICLEYGHFTYLICSNVSIFYLFIFIFIFIYSYSCSFRFYFYSFKSFYFICTFTFILILIFILVFFFFFILTLDAIGPPSSRRNGFGKQVKNVFRKSKEEFKNLIEEVEDSCKESI